ncbi:MAG: hypothetical protein ACRD2S_01815 [Terriglobales bacterium]
MRVLLALLLLSPFVAAQSGAAAPSMKPAQATPHPSVAVASVSSSAPVRSENLNQLIIPSGTKVPVVLKHAISTKGSREGDAVYAETTFPVVINDRVVIPPGTYVQGRITHIQRAGRLKGRAEVLMHFTTLIYPSGYTVVMPGALKNAPGVDKADVKDDEGTVREDSQKGEKAGKAAEHGVEGAEGGALNRCLELGQQNGRGHWRRLGRRSRRRIHLNEPG